MGFFTSFSVCDWSSAFFPGVKKPSLLGSSQEKMRHFLALVSPHQYKQIMLCCKSWSAKDTPLVKEIRILGRSYFNESAYLFACGPRRPPHYSVSKIKSFKSKGLYLGNESFLSPSW